MRNNIVSPKACIVFAAILLAILSKATEGGTIYVDADATGANNGTSWTDAYIYLQDALTVALNGDEVWVAQGIYKPDQGGGNMLCDRTATFQLISGVVIYGSIGGESILSGDIGTPGDSSDNSYHVVTGSGTNDTALLEDFTVTAGNADGDYNYAEGDYDYAGGGIIGGSVTIKNCTFNRNHSSAFGGGIYGWSGTLIDCTLSHNYSDMFGGGMSKCSGTFTNCAFSNNDAGGGGVMYECGGTFTNCTFSNNEASLGGGGMWSSSGTFTNCTISNNETSMFGGGMWECAGTFTNCTFNGNRSEEFGGGMIVSSGTFTNCIFSDNWAPNGGVMFCCDGTFTNCSFGNNWGSDGGVMNKCHGTFTNCTFNNNRAENGGTIYEYSGSSTHITNCILWNDAPNEIYPSSGTAFVSYSCVQGGWPGVANINLDPLFLDTLGHLSPTSPCINAGNNADVPSNITTDLDGNPRIQGLFVDMGAYESSIFNLRPVADAGGNQTVAVGDTVLLDGSGSSDPDGDDLSFFWAFESLPEDSFSVLIDQDTPEPTFYADAVGEYIVSLIVNDGYIDSEPDIVTIIAIPPEDAAEETLIDVNEIIIVLPPESLNNENSANALSNKIDATLAMIDQGLYEDALDKLQNDILKKTDGCASEEGIPDNNDWILTCEEQAIVYPLIQRTIELLMRLIE